MVLCVALLPLALISHPSFLLPPDPLLKAWSLGFEDNGPLQRENRGECSLVFNSLLAS